MYRFSLCMTVVAVLIAATAAPASYVNVVLNDGPIGYWRFDDPAGASEAADWSGSTRPLELAGFSMADYRVPGATPGGAALHFDGATAARPNTTDFAFGSGESFSFEYWIKVAPGHNSSEGAGVLSKGYDASESRPWYLSRLDGSGDNRGTELYLRTTSNSNANPKGGDLVDDQWHHVVGVYDATASQARLYIDGRGVNTASGVNSAAYGTNSRPFILGNHNNRRLDATLDEVAMYGSALTADQVISHYQSANGVLMVDFGQATGSPRQDQYLQFIDNEGGGNPTHSRTYASGLGKDDTVDVTVGGYTHFRNFAAISTNSPYADVSNLLRDSVLRNEPGTLELTIDDLKPGVYEITTYHHESQHGAASFDIGLQDSMGIDQQIATGLQVSAGTNPSSITTSTFQFSTLDDSVALRFLSTDAGPGKHLTLNAFDLNQVHTLYRTDTVLAVDFNDRGATGPGFTQPGFDEFVLPGSAGGTRTFGDLSVTVSSPTGQIVDDRRRGLPTNGGDFTQQELLRDFIFGFGTSSDDGLDVAVEGLEPEGLYEVTLWGFDRDSGGTRSSDWYANDVLVQEYFFNRDDLPTTNDDYAFSFLAHADLAGELLLAGRAAGGGDPNVFLNAMQLTLVLPEPGTLLLLVLGLPIVLLRRRRK